MFSYDWQQVERLYRCMAPPHPACQLSVFLHVMSMYVHVVADEAWEIDKGQLSLGRELGSGQFGVSCMHVPCECGLIAVVSPYVYVCVCVAFSVLWQASGRRRWM